MKPGALYPSLHAAATALLVLAPLSFLLGCSELPERASSTREVIDSFRQDKDDDRHDDVIDKVKEKDVREALNIRIAVAPVQFEQHYGEEVGGNATAQPGGSAGASTGASAPAGGSAGAAPGGTAPGATPAGSSTAPAPAGGDKAAPPPAGKQGAYRYRRSTDGRWVALLYRAPRYRELLFAPEDGAAKPPAPAPADGKDPAPAAGPQPGDEVEWLCPRCQRTVSDKDTSCPECGLTFAPETPEKPRTPPTQPPTMPPPGELTKGPATNVPAETGPATAASTGASSATVTAAAPPQPPERWVCFQCGRIVDKSVVVCPYCALTLQLPSGVAPAPGAEGEGGQVGAIAEGTYKETGSGRRSYRPSGDKLQDMIVETMQSYLDPDAKKERRKPIVVALKKSDLLTGDPQKDLPRLLSAADQGDQDGTFQLLVVPKLKRWDISYVGTTGGGYAASLISWVAIGEPLPNAWIAGDEFKVDIELEYKLYGVNAGREMVSTTWVDHTLQSEKYAVDQWDRGWYPYSIVAVPALNWVGGLGGGYEKLNDKISPVVLADIQKKLIRESLFPTFIEHPVKIPLGTKSIKVALLIGVDRPDAPEIQALGHVSDDIKLMQSTLARLGLEDAASHPSGPRYVTFEGSAASKANVEKWLKTEMPRLSPKDFVLIYFSGYGAAEKDPTLTSRDQYRKYLVLGDTRPTDLPGTALSVSDLGEDLRRAGVSNAMVCLDTSFAAQAVAEDQGRGRTLPGHYLPQVDESFMNGLTDITYRGGSKSCLLLTAADYNQAAMELEDIDGNGQGQGIFTYYLSKALLGQGNPDVDTDKDGQVTPKELAGYVNIWVAQKSNLLFIPQHVRQAGSDNMVVGFRQAKK